MASTQTSLVAGRCYSFEDHRGFLVCVEPTGHNGFEAGRAVATRSRPGPWERVFVHGATIKGKGSKGKKNKKRSETKGAKAGAFLNSTNLVNLVSVHNTAFQVDDNGLVTPGPTNHAQGFFVEYHQPGGRLALRTPDGRYLGTTKAGKLVCNRQKNSVNGGGSSVGPSRMCLFRVFQRNEEFDDPRSYLPLGVHPGAIAHMVQPQPSFNSVVQELCGRFLLSLPSEELQVVSRLFFQIEQMWWFYEDHEADLHQHLPHMDMEEFGRQVFRLCDLFMPVRSHYDVLFNDFKLYLSQVPVFGAFIMNGSMTKVVLVKSYNGSWLGFPRGKVNQDEEEIECAVREAREEIGIDLSGHVDPKSFIVFTEGKKEVKLFLVSGVSEQTEFVTQTRKEIRSISWYDISKAKGLLPSAQWKQLKAWISAKRKANQSFLANQKKEKKEAARQAKKLARQQAKEVKSNSKKSKDPNWKDGWGIEDMLSGGGGGGGCKMFVDEDDQEDNAIASQIEMTGIEGLAAEAPVVTKDEATQKFIGKRCRKRKVATSAWKVDEIFQGMQKGRFTFDKEALLLSLDANLLSLNKRRT